VEKSLIAEVNATMSFNSAYRPEDSIKKIGEEETRREIVDVSTYISDFISRNFGPKGLWNLISDKHGVLHWTKNGSTTLNKLEPKQHKLEKPDENEVEEPSSMRHPIAQTIADMAKNLVDSCGDGSKTAIILMGEILKKSEKLPIHPTIFIDGCKAAMEECLRTISEVSIPIHLESQSLRDIIKTFFQCGFESYNKILTNIVIRGVRGATRKINGEYAFNVEDIDVRKEAGNDISETQLVDGVALFKEIPNPHMPKRVTNAKVALIAGELNSIFNGVGETRLRTRHYDHKMVLEDPSQIKVAREEEMKLFQEAVEKLVSLNVKVIIIEKGLHPIAEGLLANNKILAVRRFHPDDLARIAKTTGAKPVSEVGFLTSEDLGYADLVEERIINNRPWIFIRRYNSPLKTILVRGPVEEGLIDEVERTIENSLRLVKTLFIKPKVVAGGGALEAEMAVRLRKRSRLVKGAKQLVVELFAEALETIPMLLAESCGLDPIYVVTELRMRHRKGETYAGVDVFRKKVTDMLKAKIYEPSLVKEEIIRSSYETIVALLRINDFIASKILKGDAYYKKRIEEATKPEKVKKIHREYDIDV
jgi:chaperonin GroEL (HSP60 family)